MERTAKDMFEKAFDTIDQPDLKALVAGQVAEHRMLEFKREYSSKDDADGELLRDLTAMANAQGGDFLIGIDQTKSGVARAILGVEIENLDKKQ
jgi:predicted HTH transcriptional regulator